MAEFFEITKDWFFSLGEKYSVNPIIFGIIYVGAIPFFTLSIAWLVRNYRQNKSIVVPTFSSVLFFISAYLYLIIAGENVPLWVYGVMMGMITYGTWVTYKKVKLRIKESTPLNPQDSVNTTLGDQ